MSAAGSVHSAHAVMQEKPNPPVKRSTAKPLATSTTFSLRPSMQAHRNNTGHHSLDLDDYFTGPRDLDKHSKLPYFMRMHGSVMPKMILPLLFIGCWATAITLICEVGNVNLGINSVLLTILGFVVGLGLSFRSSTAYERYADGTKYWSQLIVTSRNLARLIWIHVQERHDEDEALGRADLLSKLTATNLIVAFAVALKHKLRFEPFIDYPDLHHLISNLETFAGQAEAVEPEMTKSKRKSALKTAGGFLGVTFAESNPRKLIKRSKYNLGNLPLEIVTYLSAYFEETFNNKTLTLGIHQAQVMTNVASLTEILTGTERILNTPMPLAYSIAISQITWVYIMVLPFQLYPLLGWITIPGTIVAAYIILGLAVIGREIENPFGSDVNDLPLDTFCNEIASDIDLITAKPPPQVDDYVRHPENMVMYPLSRSEYAAWDAMSVADIRQALKVKASIPAIANAATKPLHKDQEIEV